MRTTIDIDDALFLRAEALFPQGMSKRALVNEALRRMVEASVERLPVRRTPESLEECPPWLPTKGFLSDFPEDTVLIGGIAVWLHSKASADLVPECTYDADLYISLPAWAEVRDVYDTTANRRLNKHQAIVQGVEIDLYVEHHHGLRLDYATVMAHAVSLDGVQVACLEHLLLLKIDALQARQGSAHGAKDRRDVAKILVLLADQAPDQVVLHGQPDDLTVVRQVVRSEAFADIAGGNAHRASALRRRATLFLQAWDRAVA